MIKLLLATGIINLMGSILIILLPNYFNIGFIIGISLITIFYGIKEKQEEGKK